MAPRDSRFLWLLRLVYGMYAYTLITHTWGTAARFALRDPGLPQWTGHLAYPAITLAVIGTAVLRVRRDPFLWTVLLAGMQSSQLFQDGPSFMVELGSYGVAVALWLMAAVAPGVGRRIRDSDREKYAAPDRTVVAQVVVVYLGSLAVLAIYRFLHAGSTLEGWAIAATLYYTGLALVILAGFWVDWPSTWQSTMRLGLRPHGLLLSALATLACLLIWAWHRGLVEDQWVPSWPSGIYAWPRPLLALVTVVPALFEEILCRGILWHALRQRVSARGAILATAVLFAMLHVRYGSPSGALPEQFLAGIVLGWLRARTDSLTACMLCHAAYNLGVWSLVLG